MYHESIQNSIERSIVLFKKKKSNEFGNEFHSIFSLTIVLYYLRRLWHTIYTSNWECSHWRQCHLTKAGWMGFPISHSQNWRNSCGISGSSFSWNLSKSFPLSETRYSSFAAALGLSLHPDDKVIPSIVVNNSENAHVCPSALEGLSAWHIAYVASKMLWNDEVGGGCLRCSSVCQGLSSWQDAR